MLTQDRAEGAGVQRPLRRPGNAGLSDPAGERPGRTAGRQRRAARSAKMELKWSPMPSVCVVMASGGYPGSYAKGKPIRGLDEAARLPNTKVFHAGTARAGDQIVTSGGRVLGVTAWAKDLRSRPRRRLCRRGDDPASRAPTSAATSPPRPCGDSLLGCLTPASGHRLRHFCILGFLPYIRPRWLCGSFGAVWWSLVGASRAALGGGFCCAYHLLAITCV